jgi:hypothetical protein
VRQRFFAPRLRVKSYDELNAWLLDRCVAWAKTQPHPEMRDRTIWRVFESEPWSRHRFEAHGERGRASCLCRPFRRLPFGAGVAIEDLPRALRQQRGPGEPVGRPVEIRAYADRIELRQDDGLVGQRHAMLVS